MHKNKAQTTHTYRQVSPGSSITQPVTNFKQTKQIIMDIDALSHSPTLCHKMLQELNLNGLYLYNSTHQAYLFEHSNKIGNYSYILVFLKQSACYTIKPDTHQWNRINTNEITNTHKIALCNGPTVHMMPLPSAEPLEVYTFKTIAKLHFWKLKKNMLTIPTHNLFTVVPIQLTVI